MNELMSRFAGAGIIDVNPVDAIDQGGDRSVAAECCTMYSRFWLHGRSDDQFRLAVAGLQRTIRLLDQDLLAMRAHGQRVRPMILCLCTSGGAQRGDSPEPGGALQVSAQDALSVLAEGRRCHSSLMPHGWAERPPRFSIPEPHRSVKAASQERGPVGAVAYGSNGPFVLEE